MKSNWVPDVSQSEGILYRNLAEAIREAIAGGDLRPGDRLFPHREMAFRLGVTSGTVSRAYNLAASWGLLSSKVGHGTVVRELDEPQRTVTYGNRTKTTDFGLLLPSPLGERNLKRLAFDKPFSGLGRSLMDNSVSAYAPSLGYSIHREAGARRLRDKGIDTGSEEVVITHGAQEAFLVLLSVFAKPNDFVLTEELAYIGFKNLCSLLRLNLAPVKLDGEGMVPESLEEMAQKTKAKVVFLCPTLQNPTGAIMGEKRRRQIAAVAERYDLTVIEDSPFDMLVEESYTPIVSLVPDRTFHVASYSKYASPTLRVAFVRTPRRLVPELEATKHCLTVSTASLQAEIVSRWIQAGTDLELCRWQRREIEARWRLATGILGECCDAEREPAPFLWLRLPEPWRASNFTAAARRRNIQLIEADRFIVGRAAAPHCVRLSLSTPITRDVVKAGCETLRAILAYGPRLAETHY